MKMSSQEKRKREVACGTGFHVRLWCNKDPCGLICAAISWFLVLYAECTVVVRSVVRFKKARSRIVSQAFPGRCRGLWAHVTSINSVPVVYIGLLGCRAS